MKLIPCKLNELEMVRRANADLYHILTQFITSGAECARLEDHEYKNADSARAALWRAIHRWYDGQIKPVLVGEGVYLVRTN